jgi:hypothetical protein
MPDHRKQDGGTGPYATWGNNGRDRLLLRHMFLTGPIRDYSRSALSELCFRLRVSGLAKIDCNWQLPL